MEMNGVGINMAHWESGESLQRILLLTDNEIWDVEKALAKGKEQLVAPADGGELQGILNTLDVFNCALGCIRGGVLK